ncbi:hypothetical protein [Natronosalvus rutilus]|uniref:Uncharacterized protein n=1 Tax=Natronosalvus rutilus TaxID=2953753 RepID=A0A9E7STS2_9EURY|nr:hypothetical protein [Natronosalvus rutilus]UTF52825.1 hypothetical protein NGM29_13690 [Natronosalvus rutilus]
MVDIDIEVLIGIAGTAFFAIFGYMAKLMYNISVSLNGVENELNRVNDNLGNKLDSIENNTRESANMLHRISERTRNNEEGGQTDGGVITGDTSKEPNQENNDTDDLLDDSSYDVIEGGDLFKKSYRDLYDALNNYSDFRDYTLENLDAGSEFIRETHSIENPDFNIDFVGGHLGGGFVLNVHPMHGFDKPTNVMREIEEELIETLKLTANREFDEVHMQDNTAELYLFIPDPDLQQINEWINMSVSLLEGYFDEFTIEYSEEDL